MRPRLLFIAVVAVFICAFHSPSIRVHAQGPGTPYNGSPVALPGLIQAEEFNDGLPNDAYFDTDSTNNGDTNGVYRPGTQVDIETATDASGGYPNGGQSIGWAFATEWLNYTVTVAAAGNYSIGVRVASNGAGGIFHIEVDGVDKTGPMSVPNTSGWQAWKTIYKAGVSLNAGQQVWRLVMDTNGSTGAVGNFNWIAVSQTFGSMPTLPAATLQVENFDEGGANVAYVDAEAANRGGQYRDTGVDIENSSDSGGGYSIGYAGAGEWLKYTVNVSSAGAYDIAVRVASEGSGGTFHVEVSDVNVTGPMTVPNTGGWQIWTTLTKTGVTLSAGPQVWRLVMDSNGPTTAVGNFNWIGATASTSGTTLTLVSFNLHEGNPGGVDAQAQFIASFNPDIVFIQETPSGNFAAYRDLLANYTGRTWYSSPNGDRQAGLLSTFQLAQVEVRRISDSSWVDPPAGDSAVHAQITVGGVPVNIWPLHLDIGQGPCWCNGHQYDGMRTVVDWAAESSYIGTRRIIGGDLNSWTQTSDQSELAAIDYIRSHGYVDSCLELGDTDQTCPATNEGWRPDAIYHSSGLAAVSQSVHPTNLSDHSLLLTVIRIQ